MSDSASQLKSREEFLDEKEAKLASEETRLENQGMQPPKPQAPVTPPQSSATPPKKFLDTIHKLDQIDGADVITRGGRPVLRIPNTSFFAPGEATLKPDGQALLNQLAQSLNGQADSFELRVESYTDTDMEAGSADAAPAKPDAAQKKDKSAKPSDTTAKPHYATSWDLTAARAAAIERYYRDQTSLPFQNVLVSARGDSLPIATGAKDHAHNRRIEISLAPLPAAFHSSSDTSTNSLTPPAEPSAPAKPKPSSP